MSIPIPKLAESKIPPPLGTLRFKSELLRTGVTWPNNLSHLRDIYMKVYELWGLSPEDDQRQFTETSALLRELVLGTEETLKQVNSPKSHAMARNAYADFVLAESHGHQADYQTAAVYQSYALLNLYQILGRLIQRVTQMRGRNVVAYGYDVSGEVMEPGEQESRSPNLWDEGNSPKFDRTPYNPANSMVDPEAENDFPELQETKHKRVAWPARSR